MNLTKKTEEELSKHFDAHIEEFTLQMRKYQASMILTLKERSLVKDVNDESFISELVENGFVSKGKMLLNTIGEDILAKKDLINEAKHILNS